MRKFSLFIGLVGVAFLLNFTVDNRTSNEIQPVAVTTWADGIVQLSLPQLPDNVDDYSYEKPAHIETLSNISDGLNTSGAINNNLATLGRVLFYDKNLSKNKTVSCGSCHKQEFGFADNKPTSPGFNQQLNTRNAISLADLDFTPYTDLFWDDRESDLNHMLVLPLVNQDEMGFNNMEEALDAVQAESYYPALFELAFDGDDNITEERIGEALSHFVRAIAAVNTKLDNGIPALANGTAGFDAPIASFTDSENLGREIFQATCQNCHSSVMTAKTYQPVQTSGMFNTPHNTGLDETTTDPGVGGLPTSPSLMDGMFKTPTLKNVAFSAPYMHDGRFETLEEVIDFYSEGLKMHPNSAFNPNSITNQAYYSNQPPLPDSQEGFDFTDVEKAALLDFMHTLSDYTIIDDPKFSDPFIEQGTTGISDLEDFNISIFPNPSIDLINIELNDRFEENVNVSIYNLGGQLVRTESVTGKLVQIERGALAAGNYLVKISDGNAVGSTKVVFK